jgi:hypothetical protein
VPTPCRYSPCETITHVNRAKNPAGCGASAHAPQTTIANLGDRITEARASGWLGEVQGLQVSLDAARAKLAGLAKAEQAHGGQADLGIPTIRGTR